MKARRSGTDGASYQSGRETREAIVSAAENVLAEHGHSQFTLKRVADAVGISVGNLNYHFPTRDALLETLIDRTLAEYGKRFSTLITGRTGPQKKLLGDLLAWVIADATTHRYTHLFRELWAMSLHSKRIARALDRFYDRSIKDVVNLIRSSTPRSNCRELRHIVELICVISEGCTVVFGNRKSSNSLKEVKRLARRAIQSLMDSPNEAIASEVLNDQTATP